MVKYKVNLKFKENGKSLNEIITDVLKIELEKITNITCNNSKMGFPFKHTYYSQNERGMNQGL